jgi:hypothetical protein
MAPGVDENDASPIQVPTPDTQNPADVSRGSADFGQPKTDTDIDRASRRSLHEHISSGPRGRGRPRKIPLDKMAGGPGEALPGQTPGAQGSPAESAIFDEKFTAEILEGALDWVNQQAGEMQKNHALGCGLSPAIAEASAERARMSPKLQQALVTSCTYTAKKHAVSLGQNPEYVGVGLLAFWLGGNFLIYRNNAVEGAKLKKAAFPEKEKNPFPPPPKL